jgi:hypothetical protein
MLVTAHVSSDVEPIETLLVSGFGTTESTESLTGGAMFILNCDTLAVSEYSIASRGVAVHEGVTYCVSEGALRRSLAADEVPGEDVEVDAPVGSVTTGKLALTPGSAGNVPHVRLLLSADGALRLTTRADARGAERESAYVVPARSAQQARAYPVRLVRGTVGEAWAFTLAGEPGVAWALSGLAVQVDRIQP